jgi:hypothetical protein
MRIKWLWMLKETSGNPREIRKKSEKVYIGEVYIGKETLQHPFSCHWGEILNMFT